MTDQTKMDCGIIAALQGSLNAKIDAQTIYHLLIDKGICTREEIQEKKKYIAAQYSKEQNELLLKHQENEEKIKFEEEFTKMINGNKCDKEYLKEKVERMGEINETRLK